MADIEMVVRTVTTVASAMISIDWITPASPFSFGVKIRGICVVNFTHDF